jgi:hypothetical protein
MRRRCGQALTRPSPELRLAMQATVLDGLTCAEAPSCGAYQRHAWVTAGVRWTGVAAAAAGVACWASRDQWGRLCVTRVARLAAALTASARR